MPLLVLDILGRNQYLRHSMPVLGEELVVGVHKLALPHCGRSLLGGHVRRPLLERELSSTHCDGTG